MPTDCGRRYTKWRCNEDTLRGRRGWVAMVTVNKGKVKLPKGYKYVLYHLFVLFVCKKKTKIVMKIIGSYQTLNPIVS